MRKHTTYVGMDVHARSIEASAMDVATGEVFNRSFGGCLAAADAAMVNELVRWIWAIGLQVQGEQRGEGAAA